VLTYLIILFVLLLLSAFFSSSETAFLSIQRVRLAHMVSEHVPGAERVQRLLDRPRSLLSAILLGNNLVNTATAAVGTALAAELVAGGGAAVLLATGAVTVLLVIFGEVVPKSVALSHSFAMSRLYSWPMLMWIRLTRPIAWGLDHLGHATARLAGGETDTDASLTPAELRTAIRVGAESGSLEETASSHLLGALTLQHRQVQEIMVPRVDIVAVPVETPLRDAARILARSGFLRLPVYEGSPDEVLGFLHVSDLNAIQLDGIEGRTIREVMRPVRYESEHASIARVLELMQEHASYLVMLVDEFGSTSGLVTLEDILEEVVGDLRSESGFEEVDVPLPPEARNVVEGNTLLVDLSNDLGVDFTEIDANTVAGLVLAKLKRFPEIGEAVEHEGFLFTVLAGDERRITSVAVERVHDDDAEDEDD
jgi:putative hemolysin